MAKNKALGLKKIFSLEKKTVKGLLAFEWVVVAYTLLTLLFIFFTYTKLPHAHAMIVGRVRILAIITALWFVYRLAPCPLTRMARVVAQLALLAWWYPDTYELNRILPNLDAGRPEFLRLPACPTFFAANAVAVVQRTDGFGLRLVFPDDCRRDILLFFLSLQRLHHNVFHLDSVVFPLLRDFHFPARHRSAILLFSHRSRQGACRPVRLGGRLFLPPHRAHRQSRVVEGNFLSNGRECPSGRRATHGGVPLVARRHHGCFAVFGVEGAVASATAFLVLTSFRCVDVFRNGLYSGTLRCR